MTTYNGDKINKGDTFKINPESSDEYVAVSVTQSTVSIDIEGTEWCTWRSALNDAVIVGDQYPLGSVITADLGDWQKAMTFVKADTQGEMWYLPEHGEWYNLNELKNIR